MEEQEGTVWLLVKTVAQAVMVETVEVPLVPPEAPGAEWAATAAVVEVVLTTQRSAAMVATAGRVEMAVKQTAALQVVAVVMAMPVAGATAAGVVAAEGPMGSVVTEG